MVVVKRDAPDIEGGVVEYFVEERLLRSLDKKVKAVNDRDEDYFWAIDGEEGSGKSTLTLQLAKTVDPSFCLDRCVFTAKDFQSAVIHAKKGQAVVFDEAFRGLSSRGALTEINKILVSMMMECRQKNLFVFIVMPTFFLLDSYVAIWRAKGLFHVYRRKEQRGFWMYFNKRKKKLLYMKGKKTYSYAFPKTEFRGRFFGKYAINEEEYRKKKASAFNSIGKQLRADELLSERNLLLWYLNRKLGLSTYEISEEMKKLNWSIKHNSISEIVVKKDHDLGNT